MDKLRNWTFLFVLIVLFACGGETKKEVAVQPENSISEVAKSVKALNDALIDPQTALFDDLLMDELSYGHSSGNVQDKEAFLDDLINGSFDFQEINVSDETIEIIGQTAIVRHILSAKALSAGTPVEIRIGIFLVYQKQKDQWKLLARQAFKL